MGAPRFIHVGTDICHRLPVLQSAGYEVETCGSVPELRAALDAEQQPDAVLISEGTAGAHPDAVSVARSNSSAPIVLFRETQHSISESAFDLVIPILVPPQTWLAEIAAVISRCRALRSDARALCGQSADLRRESRLARGASRGEQQRARRIYGKKIGPPEGMISGPDKNG